MPENYVPQSIPCAFISLIHFLLETLVAFCLPHKPELKRIHLPAALYRLVSCVPRDIIELVLLEEVLGACVVSIEKCILLKYEYSRSHSFN